MHTDRAILDTERLPQLEGWGLLVELTFQLKIPCVVLQLGHHDHVHVQVYVARDFEITATKSQRRNHSDEITGTKSQRRNHSDEIKAARSTAASSPANVLAAAHHRALRPLPLIILYDAVNHLLVTPQNGLTDCIRVPLVRGAMHAPFSLSLSLRLPRHTRAAQPLN